MSKFQEQYKKVSSLKNVATSRLARAKQQEKSRKQNRAEVFSENRNLLKATVSSYDEGKQSGPVEDRLTRLCKWKAEREKRKKLEQVKKKPPFIVGVPHHKLYSPVNDTVPVVPKVSSKSSPRKITRATEKRLINKERKKAFIKKVNVEDAVEKPNVVNKEQKNEKKLEHSFAPQDYKFKGPSGLPKDFLFGRVMLNTSTNKSNEQITNKRNSIQMIGRRSTIGSTKKDNTEATTAPLKLSYNEERTLNSSKNNNMTETSFSEKHNISGLREFTFPSEPALLSPYIVSSRGKSNARKEQQMKCSLSLSQSSQDEIPTKDTVMKNLNISIEEEERTAQYFQFLLNKEIARLNELCEKWIKIQEEPGTTEDGQYEINQAIGQTNLLINKKFERFRGLVADCETGKGEMLVTCKDLQGFWDMMYMEVKNCDLRFEKLQKLRLQGWKEELPINKPAIRKKVITKKKTVSTKPSAFKTFLAEKKKVKAHGIQNNNRAGNAGKVDHNVDQILNSKLKKIGRSNMRRTIGYVENKLTPMKHNKRLSLLHKVQLSETSKRIKSPLAMMKISRMCKTPEVQVDNTISYINSNQTPGKSILKQKKDSMQIESHIKTRNTVNFDDHIVLNDVPMDEEAQIKMDLTAALSRINSLEFDYPDEEKIHAERKLTFNDNSSDEEKSNMKESSEVETTIDKVFSKIPSIEIQLATPLQELHKNSNTPRQRRSLRRQNAIDLADETPDKVPSLDENMSTSHNEIMDDTDLNILNHKLQKHVFINDETGTTGHDVNVRILRNRTVTSVDTSISKRFSRNVSMNVEESDRKENETPSRRRRTKSSLQVRIDNKKEASCIDDTRSKENTNKRKSTRSVKFSEEECGGGVISKPTLPVTPHVRRNKTH